MKGKAQAHRTQAIPKNKMTSGRASRPVKVRWRFRPRSAWPLVTWGLSLIICGKLLVLPIADGCYRYVVRSGEIQALEEYYQKLEKQLEEMKKQCEYMNTSEYIEERGHQMGLIKDNEAQMVLVDTPEGVQPVEKPRKKIDIHN